MRNNTHDTGFTLLELSVVLAIIAMVIAGSLTLITASSLSRQFNVTVARMDDINAALKNFSITFGRLPCPSDLTLTETSQYYGVEAANNSNTCYSGTPSANFVVPHSSNWPTGNLLTSATAEGGVPVRALNLPDNYMYDAWGRRFRYAVNPSYTSATSIAGSNGVALCGSPYGNITVNDATGAARTTTAVYALMSHGQNGHGGYTKNGVVYNAGSTNTDELTNCHCTAAGIPTAYNSNYVEKLPTQTNLTPTNIFDDIVTFREAYQLVSVNAPPPQCLSIQGMNWVGDNTDFIDNIQIVPPSSFINGGFEMPWIPPSNYYTNYSSNYQYNPSGSGVGWMFNGSSGISRNGSGFTGSNPPAPEGQQVAFLQNMGSFSQSISTGAGNYAISFYAANRILYSGPQQDFNVLVDGNIVGYFIVTNGAYALNTTATFTLASGSHTVTFQGLNSQGSDNTAFIDNVQLIPQGIKLPNLTAINAAMNGSFETPVVGYGAYQVEPVGAQWKWAPSSGITGNASVYSYNNASVNAPDGVQAAYLQNTDAISQAFALPAGNYQLKFQISLRGDYGMQYVNVYWNGQIIGTAQSPDDLDWHSYTTPPFAVSR